VTGPELKQLREHLLGRPLTPADKEVTGPGHPARELFRILAMASDRYPILEMFNVFDRYDVPEKESPAGVSRTDARRRAAASWLSGACLVKESLLQARRDVRN
jgi:hypothetical protein